MLIFYFVIVAAGLGQAAMSGVTPEGEEMSVVQVGKFEKINGIFGVVLWVSCIIAVFPARNVLYEMNTESWKINACTVLMIFPCIALITLLVVNRITCNLLKEHNVEVRKLKMVNSSTLERLLEEYVAE